MIHVAPCSCELHVRIRELEAELAEYRGLIDGDVDAAWRELKARAEKAEAELEVKRVTIDNLQTQLGATAREREVTPFWVRDIIRKKVEAREREAD